MSHTFLFSKINPLLRKSPYKDYIKRLHELQILSKQYMHTVKHVLSGHSKIDKIKVLKTNGSLMKVESIAECSKRAFCNTFDLH